MHRAPAYSLQGVTRAYGAVRAVDGLTLAIARGETTALIGSSGSGKSTVLRLLLGLEWPDAGEVRRDGIALRREALLEERRRVGYVIQEGGLFPHLTVLGNLALLPGYLGWSRSRIHRRALELAELARLPSGLLERFPAELSGGQRQRVALVRALMHDPPTLLLDEPLGALDALTRAVLQDEIARIRERERATVVLITNDVDEGLLLADRVLPLTPGPRATLGQEFPVDLPRPRERTTINHDPRFKELRGDILGYLDGLRARARREGSASLAPPPALTPVELR